MLKVLSFQKLKYFLLAFQILFVLFLLFNNKFSLAQGVCLPLEGYLVWSGRWEPGRIPMASTSRYVLTASPFYVSGGNVGLNTTNPAYTLQVNGTISTNRLCIGNDCRSSWPSGGITGSGSRNQVAFWTTANSLSGSSNLLWDNNNSTLRVNGNVVANNFLGRINASNVSAGTFGANTGGGNYSFLGNVGIGTTGPNSPLHIARDSARQVLRIAIQDTNARYPKTWLLGNDGQPGKFGLMDGSAANYRWIVDSNGNVGIGTTNPTAKLYVKTTNSTTVPFQVEASVGLPGWSHRRPITIDNTANPNTLIDYQVLVTLDTASLIRDRKMKRDCGDIRFTDSDGATQLNYWIESGCNSYSTRIWVKVPYIPAGSTKTIYVYYGNPNATSASSVAGTFIREIDGLKGSWHFDEGNGTITRDSSGNNNNGRIYGAQWTTLGRGNASLYFEGDDYVSMGAAESLILTGAGTIHAWIHPTGDVDGIIVNKEGEYEVARSRFGRIWWAFANTNPGWRWIDTEYTVLRDRWTHIVVTYYYGTIKTYANGALVHTYDGSGSIGDANGNLNDFRVGGRQELREYFKGYIDEVLIFNRALKPAEILDLYHNYGYTTTAYPGKVLVRKYTFREPTTRVGAEELAVPQQKTVFYIQNGTGNVGIGTTAPRAKLEIVGDIKAEKLEVISDIKAESNRWGSCIWRTVSRDAYLWSCANGEYVAGIGYENAEWSNIDDRHNYPEIDKLLCCRL